MMRSTLIFILILLILAEGVLAEGYNVSFIHIDKFFCKNKSDTHYGEPYGGIINRSFLTKNDTVNFDEAFRKDIGRWTEFTITRGWDIVEGDYDGVFYELLKNDSIYKIKSDGDWYLIKANLQKNIETNQLENEYYSFIKDTKIIRSFLGRGATKYTGMNCDAGTNSGHGLLSITNLYDYPVKRMRCSKEDDSNIIDCSKDEVVNEIIDNMWSNINYHDRRGYSWGRNRIFIDMDYLMFNSGTYTDSMKESMIVFSESEFATSLGGGQSIFVEHIEHIKEIEKLPVTISRLKDEIKIILNFTNKMYAVLEEIRINKQNAKDDKVRELIQNYPFDFNQAKYYINQLAYYQKEYYGASVLLNNNPRKYYEDIYYAATNKYLIDMNANLVIFKDKLTMLRELQFFYASFTTDMVSDINYRENEFKGVLFAMIIMLFTTLLFLLKEFRDRYNDILPDAHKYCMGSLIFIVLLSVVFFNNPTIFLLALIIFDIIIAILCFLSN